jgi:Transposase DNA-binding/Transposase Tn5 dimerisation domain
MSKQNVQVRRGTVAANAEPLSDWADRELANSRFKDARLGKRFRSLLDQLSSSPGGPIPLACQDWTNTKAAYRFLDNDRVSEAEILAGHFDATRDRFRATTGPILVLHDTTELTFHRDDGRAIGHLTDSHVGTVSRPRHHQVCGILMHSSLAVTPEGLPLGLSAIKFWTRDKFKGCTALKRHVNPTRVPIEYKESMCWIDNMHQSTALLADAGRCVHVGDRSSDIYELFCEAHDAGTHFVFRTCVDRCAGDGEHTVADEMAEEQCKGLHKVEVLDRHGKMSEAILELRFRRVLVRPPRAKQSRYEPIKLTILHATERGKPKGRDPIEWKLITDLPVTSRASAIEKLRWYALRWKIETFHKILKSGCHAEQSKLRTAERLVNLMAIFCILSWRIFWLTMVSRMTGSAKPNLAFTPLEIDLLNRLTTMRQPPQRPSPTLRDCVTRLATLGGYLARAGDGPPGNMVIWRGMSRLTDIELGFQLASEYVGN